MRKRDWVFASVAGAAFLALLCWALITQLKWVRENKPIQIARPEEVQEKEMRGPELVGPVTDETRNSLARHLERERRAREKGKKP